MRIQRYYKKNRYNKRLLYCYYLLGTAMTYSLCNNHHKQPATAILDKQIGDRDLQDSGLSKSAVVSEWPSFAS